MPDTVVESTFDVALWFQDRARREDTYLQAQKLQRLLYLAQGYYSAMNYGRKLMPAVFVAQEMGPIEPNIFRVFEAGLPSMEMTAPPPVVENFLELMWRRFSHHTTEYLTTVIKSHDVYVNAFERGAGEEIEFEAIIEYFSNKEQKSPPESVRTADGRTVKKWVPSGRPIPRAIS